MKLVANPISTHQINTYIHQSTKRIAPIFNSPISPNSNRSLHSIRARIAIARVRLGQYIVINKVQIKKIQMQKGVNGVTLHTKLHRQKRLYLELRAREGLRHRLRFIVVVVVVVFVQMPRGQEDDNGRSACCLWG